MTVLYPVLVCLKMNYLKMKEELKYSKDNDLENMLCRFQITYDEIVDILDSKYIPTKITAFSPNPGIYEMVDLNNTLKYILFDNVEVSVLIDDVRLKSNLKLIKLLFSLKGLSFIQF